MRFHRIFVTTALLVMLLPISSLAQDQSEIGLFLDDSDLTVFSAPFETGMGQLHLVVMNPYFNTDDSPYPPGTEPVAGISAYDGRIEISSGVFFLTYMSTPVDFINIGTLPDFIVGLAEPLMVIDGQVTIATFEFFGIADDDVYFCLGPPVEAPAFPDRMAALGIDAYDQQFIFAMYPISGSNDAPVFIFNPTGGGPVPTEAAAWGDVKALYR